MRSARKKTRECASSLRHLRSQDTVRLEMPGASAAARAQTPATETVHTECCRRVLRTQRFAVKPRKIHSVYWHANDGAWLCLAPSLGWRPITALDLPHAAVTGGEPRVAQVAERCRHHDLHCKG